MYDPPLSPIGQQQVSKLRQLILNQQLNHSVQMVFVSPLSRALDTCWGGFEGDEKLTVVSPLIAEEMDTTGDIGRQPSELQSDYPQFDFSSLSENWWFFDTEKGPRIPVAEPKHVLRNRQDDFMAMLLARPEQTIAVVGHSMYIKSITGAPSKLPNCGILKTTVTAQGVITRHNVM